MYKTTSYSIADTKKFAYLVLQEVFKSLEEKSNLEGNVNNKDSVPTFFGATVLVLKGDLGSGKTTFTKCIGEILGVEEEITSPTFTIEKRYNITNKNEDFCGIDTLIHIDAFRLESGKEILSLNFTETLKNPKNLICFEWPEMVSDTGVLPQNSPIVEFEFVDENTRKMYFSPTEENN